MEEKQLIQQVLAGSESALRLFVQKYERLISYMVSKVVQDQQDAEELCQDVFMKVYDKLGSFNFESKLSTWIATIAYRAAINFAKKKKLNLVDLEKSTVPYAAASQEQNDLQAHVRYLVDQLPAKYKTVLVLFYLEGFSIKEITDITEQPTGTVKNYIHRARNLMKKKIEEHSQSMEVSYGG